MIKKDSPKKPGRSEKVTSKKVKDKSNMTNLLTSGPKFQAEEVQPGFPFPSCHTKGLEALELYNYIQSTKDSLPKSNPIKMGQFNVIYNSLKNRKFQRTINSSFTILFSGKETMARRICV